MKKVKGSFLFIIKSDDGKEHKWLVDLKTGSGTLTRGTGGGCPSYMRYIYIQMFWYYIQTSIYT